MTRSITRALLAIVLAVPLSARAETLLETIINVLVDGGNSYAWERVEIPGTFCGNGSQYRFFVRRTASPDLLFFFEGGGACWDYDTCSGRAGVLGAANPNGIAADYMQQFTAKYVSPIVNGADPGMPFRSRTDLITKNWNIVYLPYCTGDVHVGNRQSTYADPRGVEPPLQWNHHGYQNTLAAIAWAHQAFPTIDRLLVTGFSAGGTATSAAYWFVRNTLQPRRSYLLNDSGPVYSTVGGWGWSRPLHIQITESWGLIPVFSQLPGFDPGDFGSINVLIANQFPADRLAYTAYSRDYNYSRFSYERFWPWKDKGAVLGMWKIDEDALVATLRSVSNWSYFIPWERQINDSHCSTIITFIGSHACQRMEKKHHWWEYLEWPPGESYKCYSDFVGMDRFLQQFIGQDRQFQIQEPPNGYNAEDPGMKIVAPLINSALGG
ncbi:MAG TPA: pectin acetylesterase-family hydrolase [Myxococcaceae bacterium]|nr:pectin acetylesterase-family hydrolase [Myxococcaceae bacterium]